MKNPLLMINLLCILGFCSAAFACEKEAQFDYKIESMNKREDLCTWLSISLPSGLQEHYELVGVELIQYNEKKQIDFSSLLAFGTHEDLAAVNVCLDLTQENRYSMKAQYMPEASKKATSRCVVEHEINVFDESQNSITHELK